MPDSAVPLRLFGACDVAMDYGSLHGVVRAGCAAIESSLKGNTTAVWPNIEPGLCAPLDIIRYAQRILRCCFGVMCGSG